MTLIKRKQLEEAGFAGFITFEEIHKQPGLIPAVSGVYAILLPPMFSIQFLERSVGGWFKGKDPTVPICTLIDNWIEGVEVLYFGKASATKNRSRGLRRRLVEYAAFGAGKAVGHYGGRYVWQLQNSQNLLVCWKPSDDPVVLEEELIGQFFEVLGKRPFANLIGGRKSLQRK